MQNSTDNENVIKNRIVDFRRMLRQNEVLTEFDRYVFESIVDKVIVSGMDDEGNKDPSLLTFIYKTGFTNSIDSNKHKPEHLNSKNKPDKLCPNATNESNNLCIHGTSLMTMQGEYMLMLKTIIFCPKSSVSDLE